MDKHIYIDITPDDITKNKIAFSDSGQVISERERVEAYKKEQREKEEQARKEKL